MNMQPKRPLHIAIIGGGAAGYFAAIQAKRCAPSANIIIFEKNATMLAKVAITGGFNLQAAWSMGYVVGENIVK